MTNLEAAAWARAYADELDRGGWAEDAARYRGEVRRLTAASDGPPEPQDGTYWPQPHADRDVQ